MKSMKYNPEKTFKNNDKTILESNEMYKKNNKELIDVINKHVNDGSEYSKTLLSLKEHIKDNMYSDTSQITIDDNKIITLERKEIK